MIAKRTKIGAVLDIIQDAHNERASNTSAQRVRRAARMLDLDNAEIVELMQFLGYANYKDGEPFNPKIKRTW